MDLCNRQETRVVSFQMSGIEMLRPHHSGIILVINKEVFLEPVPDADVSIARCSICKEQFHSAPLGPRKPLSSFRQHIEEEHPGAIFKPSRTPLYKTR
jgi:hypothetical protein